MPIIGNIKTRGELQGELFCLQEERDYFQSKFLEQVSEIGAMKDELAKSKKEIRRLRMFLMEQENQPNIMPNQIQTPKNNTNRAGFDEAGESSDQEEGSGLHIAKKDDASSLTLDEIEELDKQDERMEAEAAGTTDTPTESVTPPASDDRYGEKAEPEEEDVRKSAAKLLAWASYRSRTSLSTGQRSSNGDHDHSSVLSPSVHTSGSARMSLLGKMIETMETDDESANSLLKVDGLHHIEEKKENDPAHIEEKKEDDAALAKSSLSLDNK